MAVRRISDLPNLVTYYQDADLNDTLIEVSYAKPGDPRRYQSFYTRMSDIVQLIEKNLKRATKTQFGIVRIGDNIDVVKSNTDDKGLISVPLATSSTPGVVKIGNGVNVDSNGVISVNSTGYASTTSPGIVKIGNNINVDSSTGLISVPTATTTDLGVVRVQNGNGLAINNGVISMTQQSTSINVEPLITDGLSIAKITANNVTYVIQQKKSFNSADIDYFNSTGKLKTIKIPSMASGFGYAPILNLRTPFDCWIRISDGDSSGAESSSSSHQIQASIKVIDTGRTYGGKPVRYLSLDGIQAFNAGQFMFFAKAGSRYYIKGHTNDKNAASNFQNSYSVFVRLYPLIDGNEVNDWNINNDVKMLSQLKLVSPDYQNPAPIQYVRFTTDGNHYFANASGSQTTQISQAQRYLAPSWDTTPTADPEPTDPY